MRARIYLSNDSFGDLHGFEITPDWRAAPVKTFNLFFKKKAAAIW